MYIIETDVCLGPGIEKFAFLDIRDVVEHIILKRIDTRTDTELEFPSFILAYRNTIAKGKSAAKSRSSTVLILITPVTVERKIIVCKTHMGTDEQSVIV